MAEYIEREALIATLVSMDYPWTDFGDVYEIVKNAPTVTQESFVKHGKWEYEHGAWQCSQCAEDNPYGIDFEARKFSNYCPNCGAKMDLEGK